MKDRNRINWMLRIIFFFNGCFYATNQYLIQHIVESLNATKSQMGWMVGALYAGPMVMVLFFGILSDRIGRKKSGLIAFLCMALGALVITSISSVWFIIAGFFLYGIGVGGMESVMFAVTADENPEGASQHLIFNQALFSIGAMITPLILSKIVNQISFHWIYGFMTFIWILVCISFYQIHLSSQITAAHEKVSFKTMLKNPLIWFLIGAILLSTGSESIFTYWSGTFFERIHAGNLGAIALSSYWLASIIGRLAASRVKQVEKLTGLCFFLAAVGTGIFFGALAPWIKLLGMMLVGISFSPLYPAIGYQSSQLFPMQKGAAFAIITFSANLGGVIAQPMMGNYSEKSAISNVYIGICILCGTFAILMHLFSRLIKKKVKTGGDNNVKETLN